jgi:hypothetical protein
MSDSHEHCTIIPARLASIAPVSIEDSFCAAAIAAHYSTRPGVNHGMEHADLLCNIAFHGFIPNVSGCKACSGD